jgi:V8-like Glu-specific endopeptidase
MSSSIIYLRQIPFSTSSRILSIAAQVRWHCYYGRDFFLYCCPNQNAMREGSHKGRKSSSKEGKSLQHERPLTPDEFLKLDNAPATEQMPQQLKVRSNVRRVHIYSPTRDYSPSIGRSQEGSDIFEVELPAGGGLVLPGRTAGRLSVEKVTRNLKRTLDNAPYQPSWIDYTPHPKIGTVNQPLLKRANGRWIKPHYGIFGADDRTVYYPSGYPWGCIGNLFVWNDFSQPNPQHRASAVLIGDRVILTAAHMAPWGSSNWAMQFVPAYWNGSSTFGAGVSSYVSDYWGYEFSGNMPTAWDMVVCRLYTPLGHDYGYFGTITHDPRWQGGNYWSLAGYPDAPGDGSRPSRQMWFPTVDDDPDGNASEVEYLADQTSGDSGGPVFGFFSGGNSYVIGTVSGGEFQPEEDNPRVWEDVNVAAGGNALCDLVAWARSNWPL